jgi:hypothetical protein
VRAATGEAGDGPLRLTARLKQGGPSGQPLRRFVRANKAPGESWGSSFVCHSDICTEQRFVRLDFDQERWRTESGRVATLAELAGLATFARQRGLTTLQQVRPQSRALRSLDRIFH